MESKYLITEEESPPPLRNRDSNLIEETNSSHTLAHSVNFSNHDSSIAATSMDRTDHSTPSFSGNIAARLYQSGRGDANRTNGDQGHEIPCHSNNSGSRKGVTQEVRMVHGNESGDVNQPGAEYVLSRPPGQRPEWFARQLQKIMDDRHPRALGIAEEYVHPSTPSRQSESDIEKQLVSHHGTQCQFQPTMKAVFQLHP
jgi:hypothetical protein